MTHSTHHNLYSQKGCIGCKPCEGGSANIGRNATLIAIAFMTAGVGLIILPFFKNCQFCGHNTFMNKHAHPGQTHPATTSVGVPR